MYTAVELVSSELLGYRRRTHTYHGIKVIHFLVYCLVLFRDENSTVVFEFRFNISRLRFDRFLSQRPLQQDEPGYYDRRR